MGEKKNRRNSVKFQDIQGARLSNKKRTSNRSLVSRAKTHNHNTTTSTAQNPFTSHSSSRFDILLNGKEMKHKGLLTADEEKKYGKLVQQLMKIESVERYVLDNKGRYPTQNELAALFNLETEAFVKLKTIC